MRPRPPVLVLVLVLVAALALPAASSAAAPRFRDAVSAWGLHFRHHHGGRGAYLMPETAGSGVLLFDADGDGDLDVLFVDGGALPGDPAIPEAGFRFFRQDRSADGQARFVDRTAASGLAPSLYGMAAIAGDVDADGDLDVLATGLGPDVLLESRGDGRFAPRPGSGLEDPRWTTGAAFADADADGDLDVFVAAYAEVGREAPWCGDRRRQLRSYCHPSTFAGIPDRFYRGRGDGRFEDATAATGLGGVPGKGLGVVWGDFDGDALPDVYVSTDTDANAYFAARPDGTWRESGLESSVAFSDTGRPEGGMGIAVGDVDGDLLDDVFVTNFSAETNALYGNLGGHLFLDRRYASGLAEASLMLVGFGTAFGDLDQDGELDLVVANGHTIDNVELLGTEASTYRQPNQVFVGVGGGRFRLEPAAGLDAVRSSRGLAVGDLDGDLDLDVVVSNSNDDGEAWENVSAGGRALAVDLALAAGEPQGIGSRLTVVAGGRAQAREVRAGDSYLSQSATTVHFGLGVADRADLAVRLRDGRRLRIAGVAAGRRLRLDLPARRRSAP